MTPYIVMGIIVVWASVAIPFVRYLERKERYRNGRHGH